MVLLDRKRTAETDMARSGRPRVRIGMKMPGWLPSALHAPARVILGLFLGMAFAIYAAALALAADRLMNAARYAADPTLALGHLLALLAGGLVVRYALVRIGERADDARIT